MRYRGKKKQHGENEMDWKMAWRRTGELAKRNETGNIWPMIEKAGCKDVTAADVDLVLDSSVND